MQNNYFQLHATLRISDHQFPDYSGYYASVSHFFLRVDRNAATNFLFFVLLELAILYVRKLTAIIEMKILSVFLELFLVVFDRWLERDAHYVSAIHTFYAEERKEIYRPLSAYTPERNDIS